MTYAEGVVWLRVNCVQGACGKQDPLVYAKVMSIGMGMVYSAPAAPIKVAFIVGAELMTV